MLISYLQLTVKCLFPVPLVMNTLFSTMYSLKCHGKVSTFTHPFTLISIQEKKHELDATLACAIDTVLMNRSWIIGENLALWLLLTACDKVGYTIELSSRYMIHWSFVTLLNNTYNGHIDKHVLEGNKIVLVGYDMSLLILHYILYCHMQIMIV